MERMKKIDTLFILPVFKDLKLTCNHFKITKIPLSNLFEQICIFYLSRSCRRIWLNSLTGSYSCVRRMF